MDFGSEAFQSIAAAHGVSPQQVALKWILQQKATFVVGSGNPAHMVSDSRLFHFNLTSAEIALLAGQAAPLRNPFARPPPGPSSALLSTPRATLVPRDAALNGLTAIGVAAIIAMAAVLRRVRRRGVAPAADLLV